MLQTIASYLPDSKPPPLLVFHSKQFSSPLLPLSLSCYHDLDRGTERVRGKKSGFNVLWTEHNKVDIHVCTFQHAIDVQTKKKMKLSLIVVSIIKHLSCNWKLFGKMLRERDFYVIIMTYEIFSINLKMLWNMLANEISKLHQQQQQHVRCKVKSEIANESSFPYYRNRFWASEKFKLYRIVARERESSSHI